MVTPFKEPYSNYQGPYSTEARSYWVERSKNEPENQNLLGDRLSLVDYSGLLSPPQLPFIIVPSYLLTGLLSSQEEKSINLYFIMVPLRKKVLKYGTPEILEPFTGYLGGHAPDA